MNNQKMLDVVTMIANIILSDKCDHESALEIWLRAMKRKAREALESRERETLADVVAEMRHGLDKSWHDIDREWAHGLPTRIETAWKRERESLIREEVSDNYHPNDWRVYVIEDKAGYFAGFTNKGATRDVPTFCATLDGAEKFDAFRDLSARERAIAIRNHYVPNAKVWAYKRHEIFQEQYRKGDENGK